MGDASLQGGLLSWAGRSRARLGSLRPQLPSSSVLEPALLLPRFPTIPPVAPFLLPPGHAGPVERTPVASCFSLPFLVPEFQSQVRASPPRGSPVVSVPLSPWRCPRGSPRSVLRALFLQLAFGGVEGTADRSQRAANLPRQSGACRACDFSACFSLFSSAAPRLLAGPVSGRLRGWCPPTPRQGSVRPWWAPALLRSECFG